MTYITYTGRRLLKYILGGCRFAIIMGTGDLMAQRYRGVNNITDVDWLRLSKYASIGLFFVGPVVTHWYRVINPILSLQTASVSIVMRRLLNDQLFLVPTINAGLLTMHDLIDRDSKNKIVQKHISGNYASLIKHHYIFWPPVQFFSSIFIQPNLQTIFIGSIAVVWFGYVSEFLRQDNAKYPEVQMVQLQLSDSSEILAKNIHNSYFI